MTAFCYRRLLFGLTAFVLLLASRAAADEAWDASAYKGWEMESVTIAGVANAKLAAEIKSGLALAQSKGLLGRERPTFYPQVLTEDLQRARLFLARRGYPYAEVTPSLSGDPHKEFVVVVLHVDLGDPVTVGSVAVRGLGGELQEQTREYVAVKKSAVFSDDQVSQTVLALTAQLRKRGYARAATSSATEWIDRTHVSVVFDVTPGVIYYFGTVVVEGADEDLVPLVRRMVQTRRGRRYDPALVDDTHRDLRILDLFRQVKLQLEPSAPDTLDVLVQVVMRDPRTIETLVSYFNDERLKVGAGWMHRNLFKKGRGFQLGGHASIYIQEIATSVWWPGVLFSRDRFVLGLSARRDNEPAFEAVSLGGDVSMRYAHSLQKTSRVGVEIRDVSVEQKGLNLDTDLQEGLTTVIFGSFDRNGGNDWINPTEGSVLRCRVRWAPGGAISDNQFILGEVTGIWYVPVSNSSVVALRGVLGAARAYPSTTELLATERFFSGGANSMRGFWRRRLGPKNLTDEPVGGEAKLEAGVEFRFPLLWKLRGTAFMDTGQVWRRADLFAWREIEVAVGPGLWLMTAVGPLRLDYAYRLTDFAKTDPRYRVHFSIGPAF